MARRPIQSALMLAVTIVAISITTSVDQCSCNSENEDLNAEESALLNLPKFGDRLAPRNRPFIEDRAKKFNNHNFSSNNHNHKVINHNNNHNNHNNHKNHNDHQPRYLNDDINRSDIVVTSVTQSLDDSNTNHDYYTVSDIDDEDDDDILVDHDDIDLPIVTKNNQLNLEKKISVKQVNKINNIELNNNNSNTSSAQAHRLEMSTEFFVVPSTAASSVSRSTTIRPGGVILAARHPSNHNLNNKLNVTPPTIISTYPSGLRKEPWVVPVLVLACLSMIMMAAFEIFVLCKAWRTSPSRRHLFLGQMLLLGLFSCSGLAAVLTINPTILSCATVRFGAGVSFALVFASLLVKCVFLISLNGGVYLPAPYQGLLLLFAVLIQVAVGTQWLMTSPPGVDNVPISAGSAAISSRYHLLLTAGDLSNINPTIPLCHTPFSELLLSLIYVVFLIIFVAILAIKSRGIRDNYREATYIGLAVGGIIPIWLGWTLCGLAVADRHRDACLAFGLVATSSTVFLVMFMPKGRQLAAMGKEGLYVEDREERFSSLSRAGSGYSPSFFHFKPIKYGVMGPSPTLNTNTANLPGGNTTNAKHQAVATLGGDRVALVTAPPSYTPRMYHYFPAHMTHPFCYYPSPAPQQARYPGLFMRPDDANLYTTLEQTMSSNPNVYFQRGGGVHPGMMY